MNASDVEDIYPLSPIQEGILFHVVRNPSSRAFLEQGIGTIRGRLDHATFRKAWTALVERHATLRSSFHWQRISRPVQVVHRSAALRFTTLDWRDLPEELQKDKLETLIQHDREEGTPIEAAPLTRIALIRTGNEQHEFLWTIHHLIHDSWSTSVLLDELFQLHRTIEAGTEMSLPTPQPYRDYVRWAQTTEMSAAERHWRSVLKDLPCGPCLPRKRMNGDEALQSHERDQLLLTERETSTTLSFARTTGVTPYALVQGMWALVLSQLTGRHDVVFGKVVSGRPPELPGVETMVGPFINTVPVRAQIELGECVSTWLKQMQDRQQRQETFDYTPQSYIRRWCETAKDTSLFDTILVFQNSFQDISGRRWNGLEIGSLRFDGYPDSPLMIRIWPGKRYRLEVSAEPRYFETARRLLRALRSLLVAVPEHADATLGALANGVDEDEGARRREQMAARLRTLREQ